MSASTVSITANPTTRRRPVVAVEKRSTHIELVSAEPQSQRADDQTAANTRDLSHQSIRSETAVDRSAQTRRTGATSTVSPPSAHRRSRKALPGTKRPRWLRLLRIFGKWFGLLVFVGGLAQILIRLAYGSTAAAPMAFTDLEGRIAEVEASMKETSRMLQVGVDVASRKIDKEVGELRKEVEDRGVALASELRKLEVKSKGLERSVEELKSVEWLSKQEFEGIYQELKKEGKSGELGASFDDIMAYARNVVEKEIEKHAADGLARVDYALGSGGAAVVKHSEPYVVGKGNWWTSMRNGVHSDADKMLRPSFGEPGQCFPLKGSSGFVQIKLRTAIIPEAITLEHVSKSVAYDRTSAPKDCRISAWLRRVHDQDLEVHTEKRFLLAEFTYDLEKSNAQTVTVLDSAVSNIVDTVRLDFTSNHGSPSHTCIYRLRVHGHEPEAVSVMAMHLS
ncbi:putative SUN domain-containing protein [Rosa chinensis]|uniref:Putative SUN domain-containing protein n=1 Tax=Rosa chinensis TaxID=74649 RepID=A0A2P6SBA0_ROSCH|nr:SUN domain-containing protein 1 [Rosa chinensis]PRQ55973.1 putative SUN domain-containing protein [Rosa chinensis]